MRRRILESLDKFLPGRGIAYGYEYVDISPDLSFVVASCNVGANSETEYGNYYMYGKGSRTWHYNDYSYSGTESPLSLSVDTARQVMGGKWRTPTKSEIEQLMVKSNRTLVSINGISGMKFANKSNSEIYTFVPWSGWYAHQGNKYVDNGLSAEMWSSTPSGSTLAYSFNCRGTANTNLNNLTSPRLNGGSVRGVISKSELGL